MHDTIEEQSVKTIEKENLLAECAQYAAIGARLVQILAVNHNGADNSPDGVEMTWSFGYGFNLLSLRCVVKDGETVQSITPIWAGAYLYENEIMDLFGVKIQNISVNFYGKFYDVAGKHPFAAKKQPKSEER